MSSLRYSGNFCAVIDHLDREIKIRSRISDWNALQAEDPDNQEDITQAIAYMELDEFLNIGYTLVKDI